MKRAYRNYTTHELITDIPKGTINRVGVRYGRLVALGMCGKTSYGILTWLCKCDCGNEIAVSSGSIGRSTLSCGCLLSEKIRESRTWSRKDPGVAAFNSVLIGYKHDCKRGRGKRALIDWLLTDEEARYIMTSDCFYCGIPPLKQACGRRKVNGDFLHNGIDRIDSNNHYIWGNVVPCCTRCNLSKLNFTPEEHFEWIKMVYKKQGILR